MNNLTQTQTDAKQTHFDRQSLAVPVIYQKADTDERKAIIQQINSFSSVAPAEAKNFWLKFRRMLIESEK